MELIILIALLVGIAVIKAHDGGFFEALFNMNGGTSVRQPTVQECVEAKQRFFDKYCLTPSQERELRESRDFYKMQCRIICELKLHPDREMVMLALAAQQGKLIKRYAGGIFTTQSAMMSTGGIDNLATERRFFLWYDMELRANGFPYELLFAPYDKGFYIKNALSISARKASLANGAYYWEPDNVLGSVLPTSPSKGLISYDYEPTEYDLKNYREYYPERSDQS